MPSPESASSCGVFGLGREITPSGEKLSLKGFKCVVNDGSGLLETKPISFQSLASSGPNSTLAGAAEIEALVALERVV